MIRAGTRLAERMGETQLAGHCLEAHALIHSLQGRTDSVFPIMARAEQLLRATRSHASLARLYSRRSDELQARGRLGEAKVALGQVLAEATLSSAVCGSGPGAVSTVMELSSSMASL